MSQSGNQLIDTVCKELKAQVLNLFDDLLAICPNEPDILMLRLYFENQVEPEKLMKGFIEWVLPWEKKIAKRKEVFFTKNPNIFGPLPANKVSYFQQKFINGEFDKDDKDTFWNYFDVYISLIKQYNKLR